MILRRLFFLAAFCAASFCFSLQSLAHDAPRVETVVTLDNTGEVEVTHTLQLSAAQRLLFKAGIIDKNDMSGLRARAQAALYSAERFELMADGKAVPLEILGADDL